MYHIKRTATALMIAILCIGNAAAIANDASLAADAMSNIASTADVSTGIAIIATMCTLAATVNCIYIANKKDAQDVKETIAKTIGAYSAAAAGLIAVLCMTDPTVVAEAAEKTAEATLAVIEKAAETVATVVENSTDMINQAYEDTMNIVKNYCLL